MNFILLSIVLSLSLSQWQKGVLSLERENIRGGFILREVDHLHHAHIQIGKSICGGTIISDWHVVTAAHCLIKRYYKFTTPQITVSFGVVDLNPPWPSTLVRRKVLKFYVHKNFKRRAEKLNVNDIAILKLASPLNLEKNPSLGKLELPTEIMDYSGMKANITGFGANAIDYIDTDDSPINLNAFYLSWLHYANPIVLNRNFCKLVLDIDVPDDAICAQIPQVGSRPSGVCFGDSGGGLYVTIDNVKIFIAVLFSGSNKCDESNTSGMYTSIFYHLDFIKKAMDDDCDSDLIICYL